MAGKIVVCKSEAFGDWIIDHFESDTLVIKDTFTEVLEWLQQNV